MSIYTLNFKCLVCNNKEFRHHNGLTNHLKIHRHNSKSYYDEYIKKDSEGYCKDCKSLTEYQGLIRGYNERCKKCNISLATKNQWTGEKGRKRKEKLANWMKNNDFSVGRPKGSKNNNAYPQSDAVLKRYKEYPPPSWSGKKHKIETLEKMSKTRVKLLQENGGTLAYKGIFKPKNPQKYIGDPTNIIWRSTWECHYMSWLDRTPDVISWSSEEIAIPYKDPLRGHTRHYFVDFYVKVKDSKGNLNAYLVEIKPKYQTMPPEKKSKVTKKYINEVYTYGVNQAKWAAAKEYAADRGWQFKILTEDDLGLAPPSTK